MKSHIFLVSESNKALLPDVLTLSARERRSSSTMGWFGSSETASKQVTPAETIKEPPGRVKRAQCWDARDGFFKCLDKNGILDSVKEDEKARAACSSELAKFEQNCAASWV